MRNNRSHKTLIAINCVLVAIVAWGMLADRPLFERTASAQGSQNSGSQRAAMLKQLEAMNDRLEDANKAADKRYRDLSKLLRDGKVKVVVSEGHRTR